MGEFNSGDHYNYYCGQESLGRNGVALTVNKSLKGRLLIGGNFKTDWMITFVSKANHSISQFQAYVPNINAEEDEVEWFCDDLQDLLEL